MTIHPLLNGTPVSTRVRAYYRWYEGTVAWLAVTDGKEHFWRVKEARVHEAEG